jgi:hypothetical protein
MKNNFYLIFLLLPIFLFAHEPPQTKPEIQNYIDTYLKVIEVDARYIDTYYTLEKGKNVPAIKFAVKNLGNETITYLKATVYFLDKNGQPFYEETYSPISKYADMKELKPNYTFRLARESYWTVKEISPSEWSERVSIEITKVEFKE